MPAARHRVVGSDIAGRGGKLAEKLFEDIQEAQC